MIYQQVDSWKVPSAAQAMAPLGDSDNNFKPVKCTKRYQIKCGVETAFIQITDTKGIKCFSTKRETRNSYNRQKKAAKYKLGPKVYGDLYLYMYEAKGCFFQRWGYVTQVAETKHPLINKYAKHFCGNDTSTAFWAKLHKHGISCSDLHEGNIGVIDGHLVRIDFGDESSL